MPIFSIIIAIKLMRLCNGNVIVLVGSILMSVGFFVVAIESVPFIISGIALLGFAAPFAILPLFPMMRNSVLKEDRNTEEVLNAISGLYNAALGIGAILGPLIGANLYYYFGFYTTAYCLGNACVILSILLFLGSG